MSFADVPTLRLEEPGSDLVPYAMLYDGDNADSVAAWACAPSRVEAVAGLLRIQERPGGLWHTLFEETWVVKYVHAGQNTPLRFALVPELEPRFRIHSRRTDRVYIPA